MVDLSAKSPPGASGRIARDGLWYPAKGTDKTDASSDPGAQRYIVFSSVRRDGAQAKFLRCWLDVYERDRSIFVLQTFVTAWRAERAHRVCAIGR
jgi:hypothetical protein